jgi:hypothetical protein
MTPHRRLYVLIALPVLACTNADPLGVEDVDPPTVEKYERVTVSGRVTDRFSSDNRPVANVDVELFVACTSADLFLFCNPRLKKVLTGRDGTYEIANDVPPDRCGGLMLRFTTPDMIVRGYLDVRACGNHVIDFKTTTGTPGSTPTT